MPDGCAFYLAALFSPRWPAIHRKRRAIIGIVAAGEQPAPETRSAHPVARSLAGLTIVLLAQIELATVSRRNREKGSAGEEEEVKRGVSPI